MSDPKDEKKLNSVTKDVNEDTLYDSVTRNDVKFTPDATGLQERNITDESVIKIDDSIKTSTTTSNYIKVDKTNEEISEMLPFDNKVEVIPRENEEISEKPLMSYEYNESIISAKGDESKINNEKEKEEYALGKTKENKKIENFFDFSFIFEEENLSQMPSMKDCLEESNVLRKTSNSMNLLDINSLESINHSEIKQVKDTNASKENLIDNFSNEELISTAPQTCAKELICFGEYDEEACCQVSDKSDHSIITFNNFISNEESLQSSELRQKLFNSNLSELKEKQNVELLDELKHETKNQTRAVCTMNEESLDTSIIGEKDESVFQENIKVTKESSNQILEKFSIDESLSENSYLCLSCISHEQNKSINSDKEKISETHTKTSHQSEFVLKSALNVNSENNLKSTDYNLENQSPTIDKNKYEPSIKSFFGEESVDSAEQIGEEFSVNEIKHRDSITNVNEDFITPSEVLESNYPTLVDDIEIKELISSETNYHNSYKLFPDEGTNDTTNSTAKSINFYEENYIQINSCENNFSERIICECFIEKLKDTSNYEVTERDFERKTSETKAIESIETDKMSHPSELESIAMPSEIGGTISNLNYSLKNDEEIPVTEISSDILAEKLFGLIKEHSYSSKIKICRLWQRHHTKKELQYKFEHA